jgi:hypothetical protein
MRPLLKSLRAVWRSNAVEITVDVSKFGRLIPQLANVTKRSLRSVVKQQAKLIIRGSGSGRDEGLIPYTPPPKGQQQGENAVRRDISRVFGSLSNVKKILKYSNVRGAGTAFNRYIREGDHEKAKALLNGTMQKNFRTKAHQRNQGGKTVRVRSYVQSRPTEIDLKSNRLGRVTDIIQALPAAGTHPIHKSRQNNRKFVSRRQWSAVVLQSGTVAAYIKQKQKNVGTMKAGWVPAARNLGITGLPKFVARNFRNNGSFLNELDQESPAFTAINSTPGIGSSLRSVMARTLRGRVIRMKADIQNKLNAELGKLQTAA